MEKKRILICGAGSIGVYLGARLHCDGHDVKIIGRRKLRKVKEKIVINKKNYEVPEKLFEIPKDYKADIIFITTKLYDFEKMIRLIKRKKLRYSKIVAIQNGLVNISKYSKYLNHQILPIVVFAGFNLKGKEIIVRETKIGWITKNSPSGKVISKILRDAKIFCYPRKNFDSIRAEKTIKVNKEKIAPITLLTQALKEVKVPKGYKETENLWIKIYGKKNRKPKEILMECLVSTLKGWEDSYANIDTGMPMSIMAQMIFKGLILEKGSFSPEGVIPPQPYFQELRKRKMIIYENGKIIN